MDVQWRKSSYSGDNGGNCVEVARLVEGVGIRDSKKREFGHLTVSLAQFAALLSQLKQQTV